MARRSFPTGPAELTRYLDQYDGTKTELAAEAGISLGQLRHLATGRRRPTLAQAVQIEDTIGIPVRSWVARTRD